MLHGGTGLLISCNVKYPIVLFSPFGTPMCNASCNLQAERERAEENKKRKAENEKKAEIVQPVSHLPSFPHHVKTPRPVTAHCRSNLNGGIPLEANSQRCPYGIDVFHCFLLLLGVKS